MTILTFFLEYYSNNSMENIGWMNVVSEIIPLLYEKHLDWYAQEFLYRPCFGNKELDLSSLKFHTIKKSSENSLKVYIPITQLIPRGETLNLKNISDDEIPYIRMVPLIDFATNKKALVPIDKTRRMIIKLFLPGKYSSLEKEEYSHFIRLLIMMGADNAFYTNPSMEAVMNWMWFILLNHPSYISLRQAPDTDNPFTNIVSAIIATYNWEESRRWCLQLQTDLLSDYALLEGSLITFRINSFDRQFKDKLRVRYICFLDEASLTHTWNEKSNESSSRWFDTYGVYARKESSDAIVDIDEIDFIWTKPEKA
ncbi:30218_t:CDS:2 [Racocetra persica]|uniref:30218_t:CDS:1 n=1 Tax=Racocetra persica TaxID=160502 RepID=A0ACA9MMS5_9GLOM|nr:30218_t:CDS:2 [Racocetra persica]